MVSLLFFLFSLFTHIYNVSSHECEVGGDDGWVVPKGKDADEQKDNQWASGKRFKTRDTIQFKYKKDSVMEVSEEEYKKCRSSHPLMYSNNGNTVLKLDGPGLYYFISGVSGHCERGLKMIIKVLEPAIPPQSQNKTNTTPDSSKEKNAAKLHSPSFALIILLSFSWLIFCQF